MLDSINLADSSQKRFDQSRGPGSDSECSKWGDCSPFKHEVEEMQSRALNMNIAQGDSEEVMG